MEIKYIWTDRYRILEALDLNFSHTGKHRFSYNGEILALTENPDSVLSFGEKISSVTAVAGPNGSGKSSICELMLEIAATLANGAMSYDIFFKGILCIGDNVFYHESLVLHNAEELSRWGYTVKVFKDTPLQGIDWEEKPLFFKLGFIYFSNMLDWRSDMNLMNLANYSTEALLSRDYSTGTAYVNENYREEKTPNFIEAYYEGQGYRHTRFYLNFNDNIPFPAPETFILKATYSGNNRAMNYEHGSFKFEEYKHFDDIESDILSAVYPYYSLPESGKSIEIDQVLFKQVYIRLYRFNLIMALAVMKGQLPNVEAARLFVYDGEAWTDLLEEKPALQDLLMIHERLMLLGHFNKDWRPYESHKKQTLKWRFFAVEWFYIPNTEESRTLLRRLMDLEEELINGSTYFLKRVSNYNILPFNSSGEYNYYSLFSRLYDAIQRNIRGRDEREYMILVLDEADMGFHPVWKKKLLKWVVDFLNEEFNPYHFQVIFTTHSPYLLSDLTTDNLLLLNNLESKTKVVTAGDRLTFGANINELLADSFFMADGLIGDFAKEKIQAVIDDLNRWRITKEQNGVLDVSAEASRQCLKIISVIGDSIVRNKLFEMYWALFRDHAALENEIDALNDRIAYLKSLRK